MSNLKDHSPDNVKNVQYRHATRTIEQNQVQIWRSDWYTNGIFLKKAFYQYDGYVGWGQKTSITGPQRNNEHRKRVLGFSSYIMDISNNMKYIYIVGIGICTFLK